jgi:hypothetical protein
MAAVTFSVTNEPALASAAEAARCFRGARVATVVRHLDVLAIPGQVTLGEDGKYRAPVATLA